MKKNSNTGVFLWSLRNFFYRTHMGDCFCKSKLSKLKDTIYIHLRFTLINFNSGNFFFNFVAVTATTPTAFPTGSTFAPVPGCKSFSLYWTFILDSLMQCPESFSIIATRKRFQKRPENSLYHPFLTKVLTCKHSFFKKLFHGDFSSNNWTFFRIVCLFSENIYNAVSNI